MKELINFTFIEDGYEFKIQSLTGEYRNLMVLLADRFLLESFGECGGMGRCATCLICIENLSENVTEKQRNELQTLSKAGYDQQNIRLSCQLLITKDINGAVIKLP